MLGAGAVMGKALRDDVACGRRHGLVALAVQQQHRAFDMSDAALDRVQIPVRHQRQRTAGVAGIAEQAFVIGHLLAAGVRAGPALEQIRHRLEAGGEREDRRHERVDEQRLGQTGIGLAHTLKRQQRSTQRDDGLRLQMAARRQHERNCRSYAMAQDQRRLHAQFGQQRSQRLGDIVRIRRIELLGKTVTGQIGNDQPEMRRQQRRQAGETVRGRPGTVDQQQDRCILWPGDLHVIFHTAGGDELAPFLIRHMTAINIPTHQTAPPLAAFTAATTDLASTRGSVTSRAPIAFASSVPCGRGRGLQSIKTHAIPLAR